MSLAVYTLTVQTVMDLQTWPQDEPVCQIFRLRSNVITKTQTYTVDILGPRKLTVV